jgi:hypothetical protein
MPSGRWHPRGDYRSRPNDRHPAKREGYGRRWHVESFFSALKRDAGQHIGHRTEIPMITKRLSMCGPLPSIRTPPKTPECVTISLPSSTATTTHAACTPRSTTSHPPSTDQKSLSPTNLHRVQKGLASHSHFHSRESLSQKCRLLWYKCGLKLMDSEIFSHSSKLVCLRYPIE